MSIPQTITPIHWNYFLALEDDLYQLARYVEFSEANYGTYSIEIARLLLSASAEVDSVLKQLARRVRGDDTPRKIDHYLEPIVRYSGKFLTFEVTIPRHGLTLQPWRDWAKGGAPAWWSAHNKVKHQRHDKFNEATLKHCLNSMAALLISVLHLYANEAKEGALIGVPKLFNVPRALGGGQLWGPMGHSQLFYLNDAENPMLDSGIPPG